MLFLSYWFFGFAVAFFALYWLVRASPARRLVLAAGCVVFHWHFAGPAGVLPIIVLGGVTYLCGLVGGRALMPAIVLCVAALIGYKYLLFVSESLLAVVNPEWGPGLLQAARGALFTAPPLGISFFVFEFVHYLIEVRRGQPAIRSPLSFLLFAVFWPSLVAGPIKRYQQFLPAVERGVVAVGERDVAIGIARVATGFLKKFVADYIGQVIDEWGPRFADLNHTQRWLFLGGIALRILFDFSGYSDIAIGCARMMGIRLPENFRWPYLATSPIEFWRRWHISLSTWIRDYIYVPLGGGRHGAARRAINALAAFALCGLWHGAGWNFAAWGIYHGVGITAAVAAFHFVPAPSRGGRAIAAAASIAGWVFTMLFVMLGWLLFFYPVAQALEMARLLVATR